MAAKEDDLTLESLLNTATNPVNREEDVEAIAKFCDQVNTELEGPQYAVRLLAHKVQSPMEREALYALSTLEACVKNCGKRFHQEIGKFRFLNEVIKVISPKYLGTKTTEKVKKKCIELMYCWHRGLPHEAKVSDAYVMLKQQGIVKEDPTYMDKFIDDLPKPQTEEERKATFEDEEKSKLLAKLLKSKNPEDLQAANRLIKNMVKQDSERMEKVSRRINELETIHANVKLLSEMMAQYSPQATTQAEREMMKELYESLEKLRPKLFRLASDTDDKDTDGLNTILKANDEVSHVMSQYKKNVEGVQQNGSDPDKGGNSLLDLTFEQFSSAPVAQNTMTQSPSQAVSILDDEMLLLGLKSPNISQTENNSHDADNLLSDLEDIFSAAPTPQQQQNSVPVAQTFAFDQSMPQTVTSGIPQMGVPISSSFSHSHSIGQPGINQPMIGLRQQVNQPMTGFVQPVNPPMAGLPQSVNQPMTNYNIGTVNAQAPLANQGLVQQQTPLSGTQMKAMDDLDNLGQSLMQQNLTDVTQKYAFNPGPKVAPNKVTLKEMASGTSTPTTLPLIPPPSMSSQPATATHPPPVSSVSGSSTTTVSSPLTPKSTDAQPLTDVFVALETIQPGNTPPVTAYDKNGLKVIIHVAKDRPREDVVVMVVSVMSTNITPIKSFVFQAAVPKIMKVKLQPPSATEMPAFNPILPPFAITQVMLLANPNKEKIRIKFKVTYNMNEQPISDVGDLDGFSVQ